MFTPSIIWAECETKVLAGTHNVVTTSIQRQDVQRSVSAGVSSNMCAQEDLIMSALDSIQWFYKHHEIMSI